MTTRVDIPHPPTLPVLFLKAPNILLPSVQLTIPVASAAVQPLKDLAKKGDSALIGVFPFGDASEKSPFVHEWGCAARITRIAQPSALLTSTEPVFNVTLQGLTRIRFVNPPSYAAATQASPGELTSYAVTYPSIDADSDTPSRETILAFRAAASRLLDRLDVEAGSRASTRHPRSDIWRRLRSLVHDTNLESTSWLADIVMGLVPADWEDKLAFLSVPGVEDRLKKAIEVFNKRSDIMEVSNKISQEVGDALSKQQKEFFLRQQLQAIQRELSQLSKSNRSTPKNGSPEDGSPRSGSPPSELDDENDEVDDLAAFKVKIEAMIPGSDERKMGVREYKRLKKIPSGSVENGVIRTYLEWLTSLPWPTITPLTSQPNSVSPIPSNPSALSSPLTDKSFLTNARAQLDADHYGLDKIKRRLIEYLAVIRLKELNAAREQAAKAELDASTPASPSNALVKRDASVPVPLPPSTVAKKTVTVNKGPILLLVGPPGCGKTSIAQSIARALQRPFQRISLGGVRDEAEIRGHRRTYVASGPGAIVQAVRKAGRSDMLLLLDEIDKVGHNNVNGDPSAALLEVLDPEQNHTFTDHYINVPLDLSQVLFIATANSLDTISAPLLDRCEVISLSGYTYDEKIHIANRYLIPKQLKANGLPTEQLEITPAALQYIASRYTREAGVRSLERQIGAVVRFKAVEWADSQDSASSSSTTPYSRVVNVPDLEGILGMEWWDPEERDREERRGVVYGMVVKGEGEGGILSVETLLVPGSGKLRLTGSLGEVIKESGELALSWVKSNAYALGITSSPNQDPLLRPDPVDVHLHLPAGAQRKDGPSAGIAMICAFVSLLTGLTVPSHVAMTGEVTLRGNVTPIGGVKEKLLGAHRAGITKVILPRRNMKNLEFDVGKDHPVRREVEIVFVSTIREALDAAFGHGVLGWRDEKRGGVFVESRL